MGFVMSSISLKRQILCWLSGCIVAAIIIVLSSYTLLNYPFHSDVVYSSSTNGYELCVLQIFKGVEPYQVSLLAKRDKSSWREYYLAHQDNRWKSDRISISMSQQTVRVEYNAKDIWYFDLEESLNVTGWHGGHLYYPGHLTPTELVSMLSKYYRDTNE